MNVNIYGGNCSPGTCTSKNKLHANIVLSGDPKQLPAVTKSQQAGEMGFKISWMEHLLETELYKRDKTTKKDLLPIWFGTIAHIRPF